METFWDLLGSSGSTFWEHFLNEKQFFAVLNRKAYVKRVSTSRSIQSVLFQTTFEKNPVAKISKELVFVLPQRKIRCATTSFFGVGGSGRRPLESRSKKVEEESTAIRL